MAKRITAEEAATQGFEALLGAFELVEGTGDIREKETAKRIALGVDKLQDAMWKKGLDCRCTRPPLKQRVRRGLDWICTCEPRGQSKKRRKLTESMMGRKRS